MDNELVVKANVAAIEIALEIRDRVARGAALEPDAIVARFKEARDVVACLPDTSADRVLSERLRLNELEQLSLWMLAATAVSDRARKLAQALGADKTGGQTTT